MVQFNYIILFPLNLVLRASLTQMMLILLILTLCDTFDVMVADSFEVFLEFFRQKNSILLLTRFDYFNHLFNYNH